MSLNIVMERRSICKMLILNGLTKRFNGVHAVKNISFKVERGDVYGFLGPNGAGKTTTIRMIMGIIQPDSGLIHLNGENINSRGRKNLGYLPEDRGLYQKQKLKEILNYFGMLRGLSLSEAKKRSAMWLERFELRNQGSRKVEELSKGNQQKIQFIISLLHDPDLIILDEPFTGLDPLNQLLLKEILNYFGMLRGLSLLEAKKRSSMWLERFELGNQSTRKVEELSKGNQQKIQFIISLLHDPDLIILDEPFTGLDPLNQLLLKEIMQEKQKEGKTIIFSTHQMEQVERLCNNICLIDKGELIIEGSLDDIRKKHSSDSVEVRFSGDLDKDVASKYFSEIDVTENTISGVLAKNPNEFLQWINSSVDVLSFQLKVPTLEQIFLEEVGKK